MNAKRAIEIGLCTLVAGCATIRHHTKTQQPQSYICTYDAYNCSDFSGHHQALSVYESCGGLYNDIHNLDRDKDGDPCETLE